ncbi:hypothetical protein [Actinopolyspora mortivallis]|uniref:hypothetical protein n=1 Tax=Actinopolyspora mortivallis TaxID=33906 RepID=UPI00036FDD70|nr:hypothetical protein [Actinopolyspora mortivallis]
MGLAGGVCPARSYVPEPLVDVLHGRVDSGRVFDRRTDPDGVPAAYEAMPGREALKVLVLP